MVVVSDARKLWWSRIAGDLDWAQSGGVSAISEIQNLIRSLHTLNGIRGDRTIVAPAISLKVPPWQQEIQLQRRRSAPGCVESTFDAQLSLAALNAR